jgi:glycosyltransferase involved in cell wall biosynthesis
MKTKNKVIVLIPHYNNPVGLYESLLSIRSDEQVDVLIVDDGSRINTLKEARARASFNAKGKIFFEYLTENRGIEVALNIGLEWLKGKDYPYISRLDCGDKNIGNRFKKQSDFLDVNKGIYLVGTWVKVVNHLGSHLYDIQFPINHKEIKNRMYLNNMFMHPSVMFRSDALSEVGNYPYNYKAAEDYAFFFKFVKKFETANIPEFLIQYEVNSNSISSRKRRLQVVSRLKVIKDNFHTGYYPVLGLVRNFVLLNFSRETLESIKKLINWTGK